MPSIGKSILVAFIATAVVAGPFGFASAQEISEARLAAAEQVTKNAPQIGNFDILLPQTATMVKDQLIRQRPDLYKEITAVVDETALKLVPRRAELDNDIARIWAKNFTEDELNAINAFFASDVGVKYKDVAATAVGPEIIKASQNWRNRVRDELLETVTAELKKMGDEL